MARYPHTIACDAIRTAGADNINGIPVSVSRSGASRIRNYIANALNMDDEELAMRIADYARANGDD